MTFNSFEEMLVWQKAIELSVKVFKLTEGLPKRKTTA